MKKLLTLALAACVSFSTFNINAAEKETPIKDAIHAHMITNGFLTQEEIDANQVAFKETREMFAELKEAGDREGYIALKEELREQMKDRREFVKAYIEANPDLQETIKEIKATPAKEKKTSPIKEAIQTHMVANGFLTQEEIDANQAAKAEVRAKLAELKEAGDKEAYIALKKEAKAKMKERRKMVQAYIKSNPDLQATIKEIVMEFKNERRKSRSDRKAKNGF